MNSQERRRAERSATKFLWRQTWFVLDMMNEKKFLGYTFHREKEDLGDFYVMHILEDEDLYILGEMDRVEIATAEAKRLLEDTFYGIISD